MSEESNEENTVFDQAESFWRKHSLEIVAALSFLSGFLAGALIF